MYVFLGGVIFCAQKHLSCVAKTFACVVNVRAQASSCRTVPTFVGTSEASSLRCRAMINIDVIECKGNGGKGREKHPTYIGELLSFTLFFSY